MKLAIIGFLVFLWSVATAGYSLHIEQTGITAADWIAYVERSPRLTLSHKFLGVNPKTREVVTIELPNSAVAENGARFRLSEFKGVFTISVDAPSDDTIKLMKRIASDLGGVVVGDEGESI